MMRGLTLACAIGGLLTSSAFSEASAAVEGAAPPTKEAAPVAKAAPASGAVTPSLKEGSKEVSIALILQDTEGSSSATIVAGFGIFVTDNIELKGAGFLSTTSPDGGDTTKFGLLLVQGLYYFNPKDQTVFYAGVGVGGGGFDDGTNSEGATVGEAILGAKYFATATTTFFVEYNFLVLKTSGDSLNTHSIIIGMSYFF